MNRVYADKPGGLIVDYLGIAADLKRALAFYGEAGGSGDPAATQEQAAAVMLEKLEVTAAMLHGLDWESYFTADTAGKLALILETEEFVLGLENGRKRFMDAVQALSAAFALAVPHPEAMRAAERVGFFQAVKARLAKFGVVGEPGAGRSAVELESAIRQVIDQALVSAPVVDVFDAAGIKKPDISILSDEFLQEIKGMRHKNLALEVLRKLLADELTARSRTNLVRSRKLLDRLEEVLRKYHARILTAAEVIDEIIDLGREVRDADKDARDLGLTDYEYAFYTAVADNESARELMGKDKLRELAVVLYERVRANASIDFTVKASVRAGLRVIIRRTLRQYGYPPDMRQLATETVLRQAEMLADELVETEGKRTP